MSNVSRSEAVVYFIGAVLDNPRKATLEQVGETVVS